MKKFLAIVCLMVVLTMAVAMVASAVPATTQGNWRVNFKAADTGGGGSGGNMTVGVYSTGLDGYGIDGPASDLQDGRASSLVASTRAVVGIFDNKAWLKDIKSNRLPLDPVYHSNAIGPGNPHGDEVFGVSPWEAHRRIWDLRVAGLGSATTLNTVLTISGVNVALGFPPLNIPRYGTDPAILKPAAYWVRMVDNKGIAGAPANGTVWSVPIPSTWTAAAFFSLTLPTFNISVAGNEASLIADGYQMQFYQTPEPSSLMALGAGLMGLGGFFSRRRRS